MALFKTKLCKNDKEIFKKMRSKCKQNQQIFPIKYSFRSQFAIFVWFKPNCQKFPENKNFFLNSINFPFTEYLRCLRKRVLNVLS